TNAAKPVIVSMGSLAASGGYQISTYATKIFASPTTITGSIGVFGLLPNVQQLANNNGITWDVVKTGRLADGETISRPKTPEELAIAQKIVDQIYDDFISSVATSRSLPKAKVNEIAQGRVWSGLEAKKLGLVDELGGLEAAIDEAVKAAKLGDERWQIDEYPVLRTFEQQVVARLFGSELLPLSAASRDPLNVQLLRLRADLETLRSLNDPQGIYTRLPFNPWID
ncbi:MAG TPA: S49 family peptidase, partial [Chroococcidiopsis sp.]